MKNKNLILAIAIAGVAALFLFLYLKGKEKVILSKGTPNKVISAKIYIPAGSNISEVLLQEIEVPEQFIQPGAIRKIQDAIEKITLAPIGEGEQILANKISKKADYLASIVPIGKRAITISVDNDSGLNDMLRSGNTVDVLGTFEGGEGRTAAFTATILQGVKVIAINDCFNAVPEKKDLVEKSMSGMGVSTVTLSLEPSEAEILTFAETKGKLKLTLRNPGDKEISSLKSTNFSNFLKNVQKEAAKPQVDDTQSLEVIRGTEGEKVKINKK